MAELQDLPGRMQGPKHDLGSGELPYMLRKGDWGWLTWGECRHVCLRSESRLGVSCDIVVSWWPHRIHKNPPVEEDGRAYC